MHSALVLPTEKSPMAANNNKVSLYIPDDVALSILSKLPLKSLKRFTCVCQSWSRLFENPYFMTMFHKILISAHRTLYNDTCLLLRQRVNALHLLSGETKITQNFPLSISDGKYFDIFGYSVNGLFCVHEMFERTFALWNPASGTQKFKYMSLSTVGIKQKKNIIPVSFVQGFGYDCVGDDYKVICCVRFCHRYLNNPWHTNFLWEIYSLKSDSWRELDVIMPKSTHLIGSKVYLNGACHWCGTTNLEKSVVSFNLSNEVFLTTPFPSYMHESFDYLVVLNGSIAMISHCKKSTHFDISILGELGVKESWAKLFTFGSLSCCICRPIGLGKKGDVFFKNEDGELVCFDLSTGMIEEKEIEENGVITDPRRFEVLIYKENVLDIWK